MAAPHKPHLFTASVPNFPSLFKVDEGFSEDYRSQMGSDLESAGEPIALDDPAALSATHQHTTAAREWLLALPQELRAEFARSLLESLPNYVVSDIVAEADMRLHFDPVRMLPQEIISQIFEQFDPLTLHKASIVSREWHVKASDVRLWRRLFGLEGWTFNQQAIRRLVDTANSLAEHIERPPSKRSRRPVSMDMHASGHSIKRLCDAGPSLSPGAAQDFAATPHVEPALPPQPQPVMEDHEMQDADELGQPSAAQQDRLLTSDAGGRTIPNWQYIYNQRRRLEQNWMNGRYKNFRLPHPGAQEQAHTQCVYTLQYSNRYVVSGSRDRSVRVWDLETLELKIPPLQGPQGHQGSVLCLQFDERPEQDVIMSGGSDADVIVWQFSTGRVIKRLRKAHTESVLNLRFDERYLVTCSKDKTIRVWSRTALRPGDTEYPDKRGARNALYPKHIVDMGELAMDRSLQAPDPLSPYSELMTFDGHGAAVNAIQIYQDEIVSASGDRKIMLWNIKTGCLTRTFTGHAKGIACVQYDGRRIVSGSSDNTVRIFDSTTAAEVALLEGHRNLVRTVQAEFGDLPGQAEQLEQEAREHDQRLMAQQRDRNPRRLARSTPILQRYFVYGAKLPPGGGGNKWSKIVSGSYDETVIIWRRDRQGRWFIARELRQEDAMRASAHTATTRPGNGGASAAPNAATLPGAFDGEDAVDAVQPNAAGLVATAPQPPFGPTTPNHPAPQVTAQHAMIQPSNPTAAQHALQATTAPQGPPHHHHHHHHHLGANSAQTAGPANGPNAANLAAPHHHHHHHHHHQQQLVAQQQAMAAGLNSRVFKLQFDARRIICCSQEPVIVGWDFANDDEAIIEACQYFGEPS